VGKLAQLPTLKGLISPLASMNPRKLLPWNLRPTKNETTPLQGKNGSKCAAGSRVIQGLIA